MSSGRSRSGGTWIGITASRKYRSSRKCPFSISSSRFLLVAAITRTSTLIVRAEPSRSTSPSCSTRSTLACVFGAHVADFVEEDRAAVGLLELADLLLGGAGERPFLVAEQLRLDQLLGNRRAVHLHEPLAAAQAVAVDRPRDQLLADAALALDQHGRVGRRRAADRGHHLLAARRCRRPSDGGLRPPSSAIGSRRAAAPCSSALLIVTSTRSVLSNGFSRKSSAPRLDRLDGGAGRAVAGDHRPPAASRSSRAAASSTSRPSMPGILMSSSTRSGAVALGQRQPFLAGRGADELVALVLERHPQRIADRRLVVDDQDAGFGHVGCARCGRSIRRRERSDWQSALFDADGLQLALIELGRVDDRASGCRRAARRAASRR